MTMERRRYQVLQSHGRQDPLLPQALGTMLKDALEAAGVTVNYISFEGGHTLPPAALTAFTKLLQELSASSSSPSSVSSTSQ